MEGAAPKPATLRSAFAIAWPASLAAIVTPLLGLIDIAVLARGAETYALAGASLAGAVISVLYWTFGFLRMSLSGLAAQAIGANDEPRLRAHLVQGAGLGFAIGLILLLLSPLVIAGAHWLLVESSEASARAGEAMRTYLGIRLLAAPLALTTTAMLGWFTGQGRTGLLMLVTISTAAINAVLSIIFVLGLDQGIAGLAAATALSELSGFLIACASASFVLTKRGGLKTGWSLSKVREGASAVISLNLDIFIRTAILTLVIASFTRLGAGFGDLTVAANHVLLNIVLTATLLLDGAAIAAETLVGQALGAGKSKRELFRAAWQKTAELTAMLTLALLLVLSLFGDQILGIAIGKGEGNAALAEEAMHYYPWVIASPLAVAIAFHLDGVYIGATRGAALRNTMAASGAVYVTAAFVLIPVFANHGLWAAFLLFMIARGVGLVLLWPGFTSLTATPQHA
ncbi:MATE family efflux transporter [Parvularcula lutaonensis]|uniref:MATE family efflux transporter n=1 Tax=Parvularcula lutaonensis TaxID=491923 RepID=A0ABV7MG37_9PROT|nr:MATE family efflux transporter [Parvularcula lutaonensis]GGY54955.1 MATE family efflux transporter [Parvularcula lutaonensis]